MRITRTTVKEGEGGVGKGGEGLVAVDGNALRTTSQLQQLLHSRARSLRISLLDDNVVIYEVLVSM